MSSVPAYLNAGVVTASASALRDHTLEMVLTMFKIWCFPTVQRVTQSLKPTSKFDGRMGSHAVGMSCLLPQPSRMY